MEVQNPAAESQTSDQSQPIQETEGDGAASKMVGGPVEVVDASGVGEGIEAELGDGGFGAEMVKKKRGRPPRVQAKSPPAKMSKEEDEDVCFICFDGGSLVLCDRRGCPKAYHPACVKRDEAFFQSKAKWNCGWHICSICQKAAHHMCCTCTYSLCRGCIKNADYVCVRGDKGFCTVCMKTIMLIENNGQGKDEKAHVDFDDKTSWEYLFKVYWVYLKGKLSLTLDELTQAKNPWKGVTTTTSVSPHTCLHNGVVNDLKNITSDTSRNLEASESKRRKTDEHISIPHKETVSTKKQGTDVWATKELLEFVAHMKNGDTSVLSQFDVQELMLEYIKRNNLRDPRKKSQIVCDSRLKILFGKPRVGHFEMLKLLEFHFFIKEDLVTNPINGISKQVVDSDWNNDNMVTLTTVGKNKKRRNHKKSEEHAPQNKLDEYAAIDVHNMNLVYLRRKLMETLIADGEKFHGKVVGSIVRIRISGSDQKYDMYRLVQVVGTSKADAPYKIGDKSTDVVLEVLNLDKKETVSIDTISNQDLSEDECRRLRQSIRCGLVKRFTVGEIQDKAVSLQSVRLNDLMEAETLRLNNLRDRASEKGHKKSLKEYVERLQRLKTPEERERRLREIPEVHSDPKMNPDYETDDTEEYFNKEHDEHMKLKHSVVSRKITNSLNKRREFSNNIGSRSQKNGQPRHASITSGTKPQNHVNSNGSTITNRDHRSSGSSSLMNAAPETATTLYSDGEMEKMWHYRDPSGKIQGPFCMVQLQKWSTTGYFPADMRIWTNREDESLLLNDVLKDNAGLSENKTAIDKVSIRTEGLMVRTTNPSNESSRQVNTPDLASPTPAENNSEVKHVSSVFDIANADLVDLPSPTPKTSHEDEKVQNTGDKEQSIHDVGRVHLPKTADEWSGYSPTQVKHEELNSGGVSAPEVDSDHIASTTANVEPPSSQPAYSYLPPWQGVRETIEFSTLEEESVSDLLAEVDAMESQNGFPSPTSRSNSFVEDLFNGSFEEFSPISFQSTTSTSITTTTAANDEHAAGTAQGNDTSEFEDKTSYGQFKEHASHDEPTATKSKDGSPGLVLQASQSTDPKVRTTYREAEKEENGGYIPMEAAGPPPPLSLGIGLDKVYPRRVGSEPIQGNFNNLGRPGQEITMRVNPHLNTNRDGNVGWDPHQQTFGGERYNNNSPRERSCKVEDSGCGRSGKSWGRQLSFGGGGGGGGYSRPPPKGLRVCKFYESGRCKKGASCNYWHP